MLERQFHDPAAIWRAWGEGRLTDAEAQAASEALEARKTALEAKAVQRTANPCTPASGAPRGRRSLPSRRREKMFGMGRPRALDRNAKARIMHLARCLSRRTEKGRAYGQLTAKALAVLQALVWGFHNARSGLCFPGYERIAEAAGCARSTVAEAIKALEAAGVLTWVNRLKRVREPCPDLLGPGGWRWRVVRTSNAYECRDPGGATARTASKSEKPTGTENQDISLDSLVEKMPLQRLSRPTIGLFEEPGGAFAPS